MKVSKFIFGEAIPVVAAHAARANKEVDLTQNRPLSMFTTVRSKAGGNLSNEDHFVVVASGGSLKKLGFQDGARLVARRLTPELLKRLQSGAVVVVDGEAKGSNTGLRLRVFKRFIDNRAEFEPDAQGKAHTLRPKDSLVGVVTHEAV